MKMKKFVSILTLALAGLAAPFAAHAADGDIVDIRAVDDPNGSGKRFGERNALSGDLCAPDNPLVAGETLCIRVRMLVRNAEDVEGAPPEIKAKTWKWCNASTGSEILTGEGPKLGLLIGDRAVYADYSLTGNEPTQFSGELKYDDNGSATDQYRYYTDFYFKYTVQSGDMGLPVRLMNVNFQAPDPTTRSSVDYAFWGLNVGTTDFVLMNEDGDMAQMHRAASLPVAWPKGPWTGTAYDGPILSYDLSAEGVYFKTVDFDSKNWDGKEWYEGQIWRYVGKGMSEIPPDYPTEPKVAVIGDESQKASENITVYIWSEDESIAVPVGANVSPYDIGGGVMKQVLTLTISKGQHESPAFVLAGGATAEVGAETTIYMSTTKGAVKNPAGTLVTKTVSRKVKVVEKSNPIVRVYLNGNETTRTVKPGADYQTTAAQLTIRVSPAAEEDITVDIKAIVEGSATFGSLSSLYNNNILRITENEGFDLSGKETTVTIPAGKSSVTRYIYAIGAHEDTESGIRFSLAFDTKAAPEGVTTAGSCTLTVQRQGEEGIKILDTNPKSPTSVDMVKGESKTFRVKFNDNYRNYNKSQTGYAGYTFYLVDEDFNEYAKATGVKPSSEGAWISFPVKLDIKKGAYDLFLYAEAPDGSTTEYVPYTIVLGESTKAVYARPFDNATFTVCEGDVLNLKLGLLQAHSGEIKRYIFLKGATETDTGLVKTALLATGAYIDKEDTEVTNPQPVQYLDGTEAGTPVTLNAFIANSQTDPTDIPGDGWKEGTVTINVTNKQPQVKSLYIAGTYLTAADNAKPLAEPISMGVAKTFKLGSIDEVAADLDATGAQAFMVKWIIDGTEYYTTGNPKDQVVTHTFMSAKDAAVIQVFLKDKDMLDYPADPNFRCTARITNKPSLTITTSAFGGVFNEDDTASASVTLTLSEAATADIEVKLTIQEPALTDPKNGFLHLRSNSPGSITNALDEAGNVISNVYMVMFTAGVRVRNILVSEMDGTNETLAGLDLSAEVVTETPISTETTETWKDYYTKANPITVKVKNVPPAVIRPSDSEVAYTNMNASANTPYTISYGANDVKTDLEAGIAVEITVDGNTSSAKKDTLYSNAVKTTTVEFDGEGEHVVVVTFTDKDQESSIRTLNFYVQPSLRLRLSAHGPAAALGTSGGYSQHYASAPGLGAGRVYAGSGPQKVEAWSHLYNFSLLTTAVSAWAYGYEADGKADDGKLTPGSDAAIDPNGNWNKDYKGTDFYNYTTQHPCGLAGYDSFVYGWACNNTESESSSGEGGSAPTFVFNAGKIGNVPIPMPKYEKEAKSYPEQSWEAIFSREYLKSDNCGDINLDGIPDIVLGRLGLGIIDPNTQKLMSDSGQGGTSASKGDLTPVDTYNLDENTTPRGYAGEKEVGDFLPSATIMTAYTDLIPGLIDNWDEPFTAVLELRGCGVLPNGNRPLNDAFAPEFPDGTVNKMAFADVKVERHYLDPEANPTESTLSPLEWLAWQDYAAANDLGVDNEEDWKKWSPERPTDPTLVDTDGDGFPDGYEYYWWYRAHVGYFDAAGNHRYATGRRYDPRNPGKGVVITSREIEQTLDPIVPNAMGIEQDTDNDGLPDLLELLIGTDPFDFDTDGDGLPDGFEVIVTGTSPITAFTTGSIHDAMRNFDGDAMAFTTPTLEKAEKPTPKHIVPFVTFSVLDSDGDTDGEQWYAYHEGAIADLAFENSTKETGTLITIGGVEYFTTQNVKVTEDGTLAVDLVRDAQNRPVLFAVTNAADVAELMPGIDAGEEGNVRLRMAPAELRRGTHLNKTKITVTEMVETEAGSGVFEEKEVEKQVYFQTGVEVTVATVAALPGKNDARLSTAWVYGKDIVSTTSSTSGRFGMLTLGRYGEPAKGAPVAAIPLKTREVAYIHSFVYQEFGFDPRTAWSAENPLAARWGKSGADGAEEGVYVVGQGGYTGTPARTREYTTYDEFLVYSFFLNNGTPMSGGTEASEWAGLLPIVRSWLLYTTDPQGPYEPDVLTEGNVRTEESSTGTVTIHYFGRGAGNGADTDGDGVPDGWELYIMAGPKYNGEYVFAPAYAGFKTSFTAAAEEKGDLTSMHPEFSYWSPFQPYAYESDTGNQIYVGGSGNDDGLNELREFSGTDSCAHYAEQSQIKRDDSGTETHYAYCSTILLRTDQDGKTLKYKTDDSKWLNKFFPTDPWSSDTDGDGLKDDAEGDSKLFIYGAKLEGTDEEIRPVDDGKLWSIPGAGLNPCSVDTDLDGLPDGWEAQFTLAKDLRKVYSGEWPEYPESLKSLPETERGNPLQGLVNCMDGTVPDAYTTVKGSRTEQRDNVVWHAWSSDGRLVASDVNRDYDHDGLENWQEYLTGTMRCWRYDDPITRWDSIPKEQYWKYDEASGLWAWKPDLTALGCADEDDFWYKTLVDRKSGIYNPHFVSGMGLPPYFSRVTNGWDVAYIDTGLNSKVNGAYYYFKDRMGSDKIADLWVGNALNPGPLFPLIFAMGGGAAAPSKYISCSPLEYDSDADGMDDYYELFHGMNPLLGASGVRIAESGPCDRVYDAWYRDGTGALEAWASDDKHQNFWQCDAGLKAKSRSLIGGGYDFEVYPWLNGLQGADCDGDDIRNVNEAIMPRLAGESWHHTDPTPLWMTDSSYANSLTRRFFRMPVRQDTPATAMESFKGPEGELYYFCDFDDWYQPDPSKPDGIFVSFIPDHWSFAGSDNEVYNWMYSFEENEGYDTDHDGISDFEETSSTVRSASDAQDADSPRRRQAMYFPGENAALQTLPAVVELHPVTGQTYPDDPSFKTYTVECWVMPERLTDQVILERAIWAAYSNPGDEELMRKNFQLAIRGGKWYTKYDTAGTVAGNAVEVISTVDASLGWHHLAAVYDGTKLALFVDGVRQVDTESSNEPEYGNAALALYRYFGFSFVPGDYWFGRKYTYQAFVIGASVKGRLEANDEAFLALDLTRATGWGNYKEFYQGYVDEIRVWDGARTAEDIIADYRTRKRYTREDAIENRSAFFSKWTKGVRRYLAGSETEGLVPELRYHWAFDSVFGAENAAQVAVEPHGFSAAGKPILSRPDGYVIDWWKRIVQGDEKNPGYGSVYAGDLDWVTWIPNTVAHLPRYDGTTLDSVYWSATSCGPTNGTYAFPRTAEPVSRWSQMTYEHSGIEVEYWTTGSRQHFVYDQGWTPSNVTTVVQQFEFTGRHATTCGDDLLPLGGAFVKYVDTMWDDQGASSLWEQTGADSNNNGFPNWWEEYADQNYRDNLDPSIVLAWDTLITRGGIEMTAGEAYLRDLAAGMYVDASGKRHEGPTKFAQTAKADGLIPDWWKSLYKIDNEEPLADTDNDGLNNYQEYVASELLSVILNPKLARSNVTTLDYFRTVGRLYLGEMLADHDQMEDHWERSLGDASVADATVWDALKDEDGDGWTNFAENRYNGYMMSTLAQLVSHAVGDAEILDAPVPSVKLTVRYNGNHFSSGNEEKKSADGGAGDAGGKESGEGSSDVNVGNTDMPNLIVRTYTQDSPAKMDAEFTMKPGETVTRAVYMGGWENRIVRGTMAPGNIDIGSVDIKFAQVPQSEQYSWTDENGLHLAKSYAEFREALERDPDILQNLQGFEWLELVAPINKYGVASDRAVAVTRDALTQKGYIAIYGERVGTIDLTTGDFEFDMAAMITLSPNYTYHDTEAAAWSYKEAIFKMVYKATIPSVQSERFQVSLAKADKGFMKGGRNTILAFYDNDDNGEYTAGEPFGVLTDVEIGWAGRELDIELTDTSAITPRVNLWDATSDRTVFYDDGNKLDIPPYTETVREIVMNTNGQPEVVETVNTYSNLIEGVTAQALKTRMRVSLYSIDDQLVGEYGLPAVVVAEREFNSEMRSFLHEGDFLTGGDLDIGWSKFGEQVVDDLWSRERYVEISNVAYIVTFGDDVNYREPSDTNTVLRALPTYVLRRFETRRTVPTPVPEKAVFNRAQPTFAWRIDNEDKWASEFGTTYTAFRLRVKSAAGTLVYDSDIRRLPARDANGLYRWAAPLYVGSVTPQGVRFENLAKYTWEVALYNAKFSTDEYVAYKEKGNPFSSPEEFRMNVTTKETGSRSIAVGVKYFGPAQNVANRIRVQAFNTPDFSGDPVSEVTTSDKSATVVLIGLDEGSYFVRAYIDTNGNGVHDDWESWGYLSERDYAIKPGIFNPVALEAEFNPSVKDVRQLYIEDCDTDVDCFPDVWEAEQNGGVFDRGLIGPVSGNAELIGINPQLRNVLNAGSVPALNALTTRNGLALLTGVSPKRVKISNGDASIDPTVNGETLRIVGFEVNAEEHKVIVKVGAEVDGEVDETVAKAFGITVSKGAEVKVQVWHTSDLNGEWKPVGEPRPVRIEKAGVDVEVDLVGEMPANDCFKTTLIME